MAAVVNKMLYFLRSLASAVLLAANRLLVRILNTVIPDSGIDESYPDKEVFAAAEDLWPAAGDQWPEPWAKRIQNARQAVWFNYKVQNTKPLQQNKQINSGNKNTGYTARIFDPETRLWVKQKPEAPSAPKIKTAATKSRFAKTKNNTGTYGFFSAEHPVRRTALRQSPKTRAKTTRAEKNETSGTDTFKIPESSDAMAVEPGSVQEPEPGLSESVIQRQSYEYKGIKAVQPSPGFVSRSEQQPAESPPGGSWPALETFTPCPEETEAPMKSFKSTDRLNRLKSEQQGSLWSVLRF